MFKRSSSNVTENATKEFRDVNYNGLNDANDTSASTPLKATPNSSRHFTVQKSSGTTRSNTPPSPGTPLEMASASKQNVMQSTVPSVTDFFDNKSKNRASTGFSLRGKINFTSNTNKTKPTTRRVKSLERKNEKELKAPDLTHHMWAMTPAAGTGIKARRLSLSLPDDFTVDVAELLKEFEYQSKLLGRHGKHLGKGATSKVTLMVRKGTPGELYAVKEFRGKTSTDTSQEYEKKIKSEFSVAKSLHHPNIVETIRLCTDHGRWNHVMEYCSEGDLFSLVSKKYLQEENRAKDRLCIFKQLLQGVNYLHSNGIAHRDIKLENLLITKDSKLKITDFGVSEVFCGIHPGLREAGGQCGQGMGDIRLCEPGLCGSMPYIAPEVLAKDKPYDPRPLDVWSSAIVMIYLTFGANLWEKATIAGGNAKGNDNYSKLVRAWEKVNAKKAKNPELNKDAYPHVDAFDYCIEQLVLRRLLLNMLNPDPEKRITMSEIINNRWMKNSVECCQLESYDDPTKFIDASKKDATKNVNGQKIYCHNHLPLQSSGHALPPMPGKAGY
jgi:protein-serine/threonine kinase